MSKKSRKKRIRDGSTSMQSASSSQSSVNPRQKWIRTKDDFQPDYTYVIEDLKRIGILAGSFVTLLIVLSLFLR
ncbi:MAG: hypothetical protein A2Z14_05975 [Chloroflexi bacterium RBG_16_48_8]|nr:MAG: hypothetical protein A2Z14_05975 [Chloroflexi bacterium RBG_16_48_8]